MVIKKKVRLDNQKKALEKKIKENKENDIARRETETQFLKQQKLNLENLLKSVENSAK